MSRGKRRRAAGRLAALAVLLPLGRSIGAQEARLEAAAEPIARATSGEGPLQNDVFLPVDEAAQETLFDGDDKLVRARAERARGQKDHRGTARLFDEVWDAWLAALGTSANGSVGTAPEDEGRRRLTEGSTHAVERRLADLSADERAAWLARAEPGGAAALAMAGGATAWAEVERRYPRTRAAARACLRLADAALEAGRDAAAQAHAARGQQHARWLPGTGDEGLAAACERRLAAVAGGGAALVDADTSHAGWRAATTLVSQGSIALDDPAQPGVGLRGLAPGRGVRPGLAWLDADRVAIQTAGLVHIVDLGQGRPKKEARFAPPELVAAAFGALAAPFAARSAPGWPLLPEADEGTLYLVQGRAFVPRGDKADVEPNALIALVPPPVRRASSARPRLPRLRWAVCGDQHVDATGRITAISGLSQLQSLEFQPGLVLHGETLVGQAREYGEQTRAWLLAFDRATGKLLWKLFLAEGADLNPSGGRFGGGTGPRLAAAPPVRSAGQVLAMTHLGAAVLADLVDGRAVWSLAYRRRAAQDPGWSGSRPLLSPAATSAAPLLLLAPADSDRLYRLAPLPLTAAEPAALLAWTPTPIAGAEALVAGGPTETVVLGRSGPARALSRRPTGGADPIDALHLGPGERFRGSALASAERVLACTDRGLYLFDRSRDLYLLDYATLPPLAGARGRTPDSPAGGDLHARGKHVLALGIQGLWAFQAE